MRAFLKKVLLIIGEKKRHIPWMLALYFFGLALELIGLSLIIPFIAVIQNPDNLDKVPFWEQFSGVLDIESSTQALLIISGIVFGVYFIKTILNIQIQRLILNFSYDLQIYLRKKYTKLFLQAPYLFHTKRRSSEIINMLQSHINIFARAIVASLMRIIGEGFTLIAIFIFLLLAYPIPTLTAFFILAGFGFFYDQFVRRRLNKAGEELIRANNDMIRTVKQGIESIKESHVLGCKEYFQEEITDSSTRASRVNCYVAIMQMMPRYILEFLVVGVVVLSAMLMIIMGQDNVINSLAVFAVAAVRLMPTANQIVSNMGSIRYSKKAVEELYCDLHALSQFETNADTALSEPVQDNAPPLNKKKPTSSKTGNALIGAYQSIALRNISFAYPGAKSNALNKVNIAIKKGEIVGISGASGAGKTTLVDIILGLIEPDSGEFIYNERPIQPGQWANNRLAAYIPQKPVMLDDSVIRNIALGSLKIDTKKIKQVLKKAQLTKVINNLPKKENTVIGEDAVFLSGGQRQRIAIARAFYYDRELIIFDEATTALDRDVEIEILESIKELKKDASIIIISHNQQVLQICDRVCYLSDGKLTEKAA